MQLQRPLGVITPTVDGDVLTVLARAETWFTVPTVHELAGRHSESGVRKALQRLAEQGLVTSEVAGRAIMYRLNRDHLAANAVLELANLSSTLLSRIAQTVAHWKIRPALVMLFGSAARAEMTLESDIDLFVVRTDDAGGDDLWHEQLGALEEKVTSWTGNDCRILAYTQSELAAGPDPVLADIARDGRFIYGDRAVLRGEVGVGT